MLGWLIGLLDRSAMKREKFVYRERYVERFTQLKLILYIILFVYTTHLQKCLSPTLSQGKKSKRLEDTKTMFKIGHSSPVLAGCNELALFLF
jgi:hypothetical protein